ncbi:hypothetical protein QR680_000949 [Steinernema hermaphroditum]|uniref:Activin types I and II receptor domain-containing protein n=1 Tax=Steinernema hermaphroditum TaxID=289476 RepID=A0AA39GY08_9BILA|nr:hypothetical protein QR680_000949 [Steinernema hermaphroditum]
MRFVITIVFVSVLVVGGAAISCVRCPFIENNMEDRKCEDRCEGDLCFIVVNKYGNATIVAGCAPKPEAKEADLFAKSNLCYATEDEKSFRICGCMLSDLCNDPSTPASEFMSINESILHDVYESSMKGEEGGNETIRIHPTLTVEMDDVTKASPTKSKAESEDSGNSVGEVKPVDFESSEKEKNSESEEVDSDEEKAPVEETADGTKISVLPTDSDDEEEETGGESVTSVETRQTPSHPVSINEKSNNESISMKNMTAIGEVEETDMDGNDEDDDDAESESVVTTESISSAESSNTTGPVASASVHTAGSKSGMRFLFSVAVPIVSFVIVFN